MSASGPDRHKAVAEPHCARRGAGDAHGYPDKWTNSTRAEYYGVVVIDNEPTIKITSVAEFGHSGPNGAAPPDGRAIGTVTSYCQGMTWCPYEINVWPPLSLLRRRRVRV